MAVSRIIAFALAIQFLCYVAGCATKPEPVSVVIAPQPVEYTCSQLKRLADETRALPADAMLAVAMNDYRKLRLSAYAVQGLSGPPRCQK